MGDEMTDEERERIYEEEKARAPARSGLLSGSANS
jgi:hypothetical protein